MATPALGQDLEQQQQPATQDEPTTTTPAQGTAEDRKNAFGLDANDEKNLLKIRSDLQQDWSIAWRQVLRENLKQIEYDKGNQFVVWDPFATAYQPYATVANVGVTQGSEQSTDSIQYQCEFNVIQWLRKVFTSTIGSQVPSVEWWPGDSESDLDNRAAMARGRAYHKIEGDNKVKDCLDQALEYFFLTGGYFRYMRWSMDKTVTGTHYEDVYGWQDKVVAPDRYTCPDCGTDNPANMQSSLAGGTTCLNCKRPLNSANFYPAQSVKLPVVVGQKEVPNGQVRWNFYNLLNVQVMPTADTGGPGVIGNSPILDLSVDITRGAFRKMFPDTAMWGLANSVGADNASSDAELARMARQRALSPGAYRLTAMPNSMMTYHRVWFTPESINNLDKKEDAQKLADKIGDGCVVAILNDKIIDVQKAILKKQWTWCGAKRGNGAYPPAPVKVAMPFQDRINDRTNAVDEFHDRAGNPPIFVNSLQLSESMNGKTILPGTFVELPVNGDLNLSLDKAVFQPTFHMDNGIYQWISELIQYVQLLVGILPQTYGGSDPNIQTMGGQEQALKTAQGVLWLNWNQIRGEFTEAANLSVDCFAENATEDEYNVTKSEDAPDFENEPIRLVDLNGKAVARAEANQDYPISYEQQRELFMNMLGMASGKEPNPLVMEMLDTFENRRVALRLVGTPDMELPETPARYKVLNDITLLVAGQPTEIQVPGTDPQSGQPMPQTILKPSVEPDKDFDDFNVLKETVIRYVQKHYKELTGTPALDNLRAYLGAAVQMERQKGVEDAQAQALLNPAPPPPPGPEPPPTVH